MSAGRRAIMLVATCGLLLPSVATQSHGDTHPNLPHDPRTTPDCTFWVDVLGSTTCQDVIDHWYVTLGQLTLWNPSLSIGPGNTCEGWQHYVSYCVEAYNELQVTTTAVPITTTLKPISSTSTSGPSSSATWKKRGCYLDSDPRTLAEQVFEPLGENSMTVDGCQTACWAKNYVFAGVEAGKNCFCGNSIRNEWASDAAKSCTMVCTGDSSQLCGGINRIIVYEGVPISMSTSTTSTSVSHVTTIDSPVTPIASPVTIITTSTSTAVQHSDARSTHDFYTESILVVICFSILNMYL